MSNLLRLSFWFNLEAIPFMPWLESFLPLLMGIFSLTGIAGLLYARYGKDVVKEMRKLIRQCSTLALIAGVSGGLLYFFHWQGVPYLSMRLLWLFWIAGYGYWGYVIWHEHYRVLPVEQAKLREREAYEKWLPKSKR